MSNNEINALKLKIKNLESLNNGQQTVVQKLTNELELKNQMFKQLEENMYNEEHKHNENKERLFDCNASLSKYRYLGKEIHSFFTKTDTMTRDQYNEIARISESKKNIYKSQPHPSKERKV